MVGSPPHNLYPWPCLERVQKQRFKTFSQLSLGSVHPFAIHLKTEFKAKLHTSGLEVRVWNGTPQGKFQKNLSIKCHKTQKCMYFPFKLFFKIIDPLTRIFEKILYTLPLGRSSTRVHLWFNKAFKKCGSKIQITFKSFSTKLKLQTQLKYKLIIQLGVLSHKKLGSNKV